MVGERGLRCTRGGGPCRADPIEAYQAMTRRVSNEVATCLRPERALNRFVTFANESQTRPDRQVIDDLLRLKGK
jgi:hypothetical protein